MLGPWHARPDVIEQDIDRWAVPTLDQDESQASETQRDTEVADEVPHDHDVFRGAQLRR